MPDRLPRSPSASSPLFAPDVRPGPPRPLRVLAALMVLVEPLLLGVLASAALPRLALFGAPAYALLAARGAVAAFGIVAGRRLWSGEDGAWRAALVWLLLSAALALLTLATPYFPANRTPDGKRLAVAVTSVWYGGWVTYVACHAAARRARRRS